MAGDGPVVVVGDDEALVLGSPVWHSVQQSHWALPARPHSVQLQSPLHALPPMLLDCWTVLTFFIPSLCFALARPAALPPPPSFRLTQ